MLKFTLAAPVALLLVGSASPSFARGGKKEAGTAAMPASMNQQFEWENKVVGPKEGLDHDKVAATRERGIREDEERKKQAPVKVKRTVAEPSTASIPTQDIEKPAAPVEHKKKVAAAQAPRQKDALDNLLDEQGVKPNRPTGGGTGDGLGSLLANDDKPSKASGKKAAKKSRRGHN